MRYVVRSGETVSAVSRRLGLPFSELKKANPQAVGRAENGCWFYKAGAVLTDPAGTVRTYVVRPGETVRAVCRKLGLSFKVLRELHPEAVGRTADGRWFFREGARLTVPGDFSGTLARAAGAAGQGPAPSVDDDHCPSAQAKPGGPNNGMVLESGASARSEAAEPQGFSKPPW